MNNYNIPGGYSVLSYIESTGTQYIDTGFIPNQDTRVVMELTNIVVSGKHNYFFGARTSTTSNAYFFSYNSGGYYRSGYNTTNGTLDTSYTQSGIFTVDKDKEVTYINGVQAHSATYASFTSPGNLVLGAVNQKGTITYGTIKIHSCKIYDNDILVRDYVPVINDIG